MTRPLYAEAVREPVSRLPRGHAGLWYDKFCWGLSGGSSKLAWINTVTDSPVGSAEHLAEHSSRIVQLVESRSGRWAALTTESRFVTGLGRSHPVENGFAWHPTLGVPFLPGSSVKGMARAWAKMEGTPRAQIERIFGEQDHGGGVTFLDAVPVQPVRLEADLMTPHYAGWTEDDPPGDWRSPTPVPFLTTATGATFLFAVLPGRGDDADDLDAAWGLVADALAWAGAGTKTAVGYGRLNYDGQETHRLVERNAEAGRVRAEEKRRSEAMKTPEGRWRVEVEDLRELQLLDLVRVQLEGNGLEDWDERRAFAAAIMSVHGDMVALWKTGRKQDAVTNVGRRRLRDRAELIEQAIGNAGAE